MPAVTDDNHRTSSSTRADGKLGRTVFGKYHVIARLARGGMGDVFLAVNVGPAGVRKLVVVKELLDELVALAEFRSMFLDEARLATRLNHPNVVQTYEVVEETDSLYLTMEFLDGQPLQRIIRGAHRKRFPLATQLRILTEVLAGLNYAHELTDYDGTPLDVVHRDVTPHNIIVTYEGTAKLVDFGIAKAADATTVTASGIFKGKVRFASPEQVNCKDIDRRADVFSVGAVLWEMLTGEQMWRGLPDASVFVEIASGRIPEPRAVQPSIPEELNAICARALALKPDDRYPTANAFRSALLEYLRKSGEEAVDLAGELTSVFFEERREMRAIIDAQVKAVCEASSHSRRMPRPVPEISTPPPAPSGSQLTRNERAKGAPSRSRLGPLVVVGAAATAIAISTVYRQRARQAEGDKHAAVGFDAPTPSTSASVARVHLRVGARPASAHFTIDGEPVTANPYEADVTRDGAVHHIVARADGYEPREMDTRFDHDVSIDLDVTTPEPALLQPRSGRSPAMAPAEGKRPPATKLERPIEPEDPYGR